MLTETSNLIVLSVCSVQSFELMEAKLYLAPKIDIQ